MISLVIDASTYRGTVAVLGDDAVVASGEAAMRGRERDALMPAVISTLEQARVRTADLDRVICGAGPGSFTSLRIAAGIAKGIALGSAIPLFAVPSMGLVLAATQGAAGRYLVTLNALRGDWYAGLYDRAADGTVSEVRPFIVVADGDLRAMAATHEATIVGDAAGTATPDAAGCVHLLASVDASGPVDLESWEPDYGRLAEAQVRWEAAHGRAVGS